MSENKRTWGPTLRFIYTLSQLSRLIDVLQIHIPFWRIAASETLFGGECLPCCTNIVQNNTWNQSGTSRRTWFVFFSPSIERLHLLGANVVHDVSDIWSSLLCVCAVCFGIVYSTTPSKNMNPLKLGSTSRKNVGPIRSWRGVRPVVEDH